MSLYLLLGHSPLLFGEKPTPPILDEGILKIIQHEVSGSICFEHIGFLSTLNRELGSRDHHQACQYVIDKASQYGLREPVIERYPLKADKEGFWKYLVSSHDLWDGRR